MDPTALRAVVEAVVFAAEEPVSLQQMAEILNVDAGDLEPVIEELKREYEAPGRGLRLAGVAGGYRFMTRPDYHAWIKILFKNQRSVRLSRAALETLAIISYKQPITGPEIEEIRKVDTTSSLKNLLEKRLIKVLGRKEVVGRPMLYGTTREFLLQFGLKNLSELPRLEEFEELLMADLGETPEGDLEPVADSESEATGGAPGPEIPAATPVVGDTEEVEASRMSEAPETAPEAAPGAGEPEGDSRTSEE